LAVNGKYVLIDKDIVDHMKELTSDVKDGETTFKLYSTHLGSLALFSDPIFENISAVVEKQVNLNELRYYMHPGWF